MTTLAINYVVNPLGNFWQRLERTLTIIGYSRAAAELARQGRGDLAKKLIQQRAELETK